MRSIGLLVCNAIIFNCVEEEEEEEQVITVSRVDPLDSAVIGRSKSRSYSVVLCGTVLPKTRRIIVRLPEGIYSVSAIMTIPLVLVIFSCPFVCQTIFSVL